MEKEKDELVRRPPWLKVKVPTSQEYFHLHKSLSERKLATVCQEARCPNISECWAAKTVTIMILGDTCTRACRFCAVKTGNPRGYVDSKEVENTLEMIQIMNPRYVVLTSVDRDDLEDLGSGHFAHIIQEIKKNFPSVFIEALVPDFQARSSYLDILAQSQPLVVAQNVETVKRLTHLVRDKRASYEGTLFCLEYYKKNYPHLKTKTSLMVGLGETWEELSECVDTLARLNVNIVTFGQYLQPTKKHLPVKRYYTPDEFLMLKNMALTKGIDFVASGPLVRSSYKASEYLDWLRVH